MKRAERDQRLLRRIYWAGGSLMDLGGIAILIGVLTGWYSGITPTGTGHFSPIHGLAKPTFYGLIIAPAAYYLIASNVVKRLPPKIQGQFLGVSLLATIAMGIALAAAIGASLPWRDGDFLAQKLHFGIWFSLAGAAVGLIGAGVTGIAVVGKEEQRKSAEAAARRAERKCPYCAETIKAEAIICKHCGSSVSPAHMS